LTKTLIVPQALSSLLKQTSGYLVVSLITHPSLNIGNNGITIFPNRLYFAVDGFPVRNKNVFLIQLSLLTIVKTMSAFKRSSNSPIICLCF
uniref:hypothetical protein n=1 Tax=Photorhabdus sp. RM322S TaxID=3342825 RepID=UPI0036D7C1EE